MRRGVKAELIRERTRRWSGGLASRMELEMVWIEPPSTYWSMISCGRFSISYLPKSGERSTPLISSNPVHTCRLNSGMANSGPSCRAAA